MATSHPRATCDSWEWQRRAGLSAGRGEQTVGMQDEPRQTEEHSPHSAAVGISSGSWGRRLPGAAARSAGQHPLPHALPPAAPSSHLCDTREGIQTPQSRTQAPAAAWSSPQATHGCSTAAGAAKGLRTEQCHVPAQPQQLCQQGSSSGARAVTPTTGLKELPGDSLNSSSQILFIWLFGILHKSFHSCLLLSAFNLLSTVLLQKSLLQQLWITVRETTSETLL